MKCQFCDNPVTSTIKGVTTCRACHYAGRWIELDEPKTAIFIAALGHIPGVVNACPMHTGGGCWAIHLTLENGVEYLIGVDGSLSDEYFDHSNEDIPAWGADISYPHDEDALSCIWFDGSHPESLLAQITASVQTYRRHMRAA